MIYGRDFNGTHVPPEIKRLFAYRRLNKAGTNKLHLKGVCNTPKELDAMRVQANNGFREIVVSKDPRRRDGQDWYALYAG